MVLRHLSRHDGRDLGVERRVTPRLPGEADLRRDRDEFVGGFQHRADAERFPRVGVKRRATCACALEPKTTRLVACGRFAERQARGQGKRPATRALLGRRHDGTHTHPGHCQVGGKPDQPRLRRRLGHVHQRLPRLRPEPRNAQVAPLNHALRGP